MHSPWPGCVIGEEPESGTRGSWERPRGTQGVSGSPETRGHKRHSAAAVGVQHGRGRLDGKSQVHAWFEKDQIVQIHIPKKHLNKI